MNLRPKRVVAVLSLILCAAMSYSQASLEVLIDCGSKQVYTDVLDRAYLSDQFFSDGSAFESDYVISRTLDDELFNTERFGTFFSYSIPITNGEYTVELWFAETFFERAGARRFDVVGEGLLLLENFDIYQEAGGSRIAYLSRHNVRVADGALQLDFSSAGINGVGDAKINAIVIRPINQSTPPVLQILEPENNQLFRRGTVLNIQSIAGDAETPYLSSEIDWTLDDQAFAANTEFRIETESLDFGEHLLQGQVTDEANQVARAELRFTLVSDNPPRIQLIAPSVNDRFGTTGTVQLQAQAEDADEGDISDRIRWESDLDGAIGQGSDLRVTLSEGAHFITASITDASGLTQSSTTGILVEAPLDVPFYINCGTPEDRELGGILWQGDRNFSGGRTYATLADVTQSLDLDNVYKSERYDVRDFNYTFPVDPGTYTVQLLMAEIWFVTTGIGGTETGSPFIDARKFSVVIEGDTLLPDLDLNALSGSVYPVAEEFVFEQIEVVDGALNIEFLRDTSSNYPKVNGIAVCQNSNCLEQLERPNVQLTSFTGSATDGVGDIRWSTERELGNIGFELERSIDGITYELIGFLPGFLNSTGNRPYRFTDRGFLGQAFYRITAQFLDGNSVSFDPIFVEDADFLADRPIVYPNPVRDNVQLFFGPNFTPTTTAKGFLFDTSGQLLGEFSGTLGDFADQLSTRLQQLPRGMYQLQVETENVTYNQKVVKE